MNNKDRCTMFVQEMSEWDWEWHRLADMVKYICDQVTKDHSTRRDRMLNMFLDQIIETVMERLKISKKGVFHLTRINESFTRPFMGTMVNVKFQAEDGWLSDLTELSRVVSCNFILQSEHHRIAILSLSLKTAELMFPCYHLSFGVFRFSGGLRMELKSNLIQIQLSVKLNNNRKLAAVTVDSVHLDIGKYKIHLTRSIPYVKSIFKVVLAKCREELQENIEKQLGPYLQQIVDSHSRKTN